MDGDRTGTGRQRVTVAEAARILDTTAEAIRIRIKPGTLESVKESKHVFVLLRPDQTGDRAELLAAKDETIAALREPLEQANERDRENRRIIAALTQRIPAIEAPQEATETPSEATPQPGGVAPQPAVQSTQAQESPEMAMPEAGGGPLPRDQQAASERPWWRRMFGG